MSDGGVGGVTGGVPVAYDAGALDLDAGLPPAVAEDDGEGEGAVESPGGGIGDWAFVMRIGPALGDTAARATTSALRAAGSGAPLAPAAEAGTALELLGGAALRGLGLLALVTLKGDGPDTSAAPEPQVGFPTGPNGERPPRPGFLPGPGETPPGLIVLPRTPAGDAAARPVASAGRPPASGPAGAAPTDEPPTEQPPQHDAPGLWTRLLRWLMPAEAAAVRGPGGRRHEALVAVGPDTEVPLRPPEAPFTCTASYRAFAREVEARPALALDEATGLRLGQGQYKQVHEFEPEPGWVIAVLKPRDTVVDARAPAQAAPGPEGLIAAAREAVTSARLAAIGLPVVPLHGLVRLQTAQGEVRLGLVSDRIDGAIDARAALREPMRRNAALGLPLASGIAPEVIGALSAQSLADLDRVLDARVARSFRIEDEQYLLDPATGHLLLSDAQGLVAMDDVWGPRDLAASLQFRNHVAALLGAPARAMPDLGEREFTPWWRGQPSGVALEK